MKQTLREVRYSGLGVVFLGCLTVLATLPVAVEFVRSPRIDIGVGILVGLVSGAGVLYGAYRVRDDFPPYAVGIVTDRTVLGVLLLGLLTSPVLLAGEPDRPFQLFRTLASVGMLTGFLVGHSQAKTEVIRQQADHLEDEREQFELLSSLLRHDVSNKLLVLRGTAQRQLEAGVESRETRESLEMIEQTATDIQHMLGDMEALTESTAPEDWTRIDVESLFGPELETVEAAPDATLETDVEPGLQVRANEPLSSAFRNLLQNAVEHNDAPTVSVTAESVDGEVEVRIADDGSGIPPDRRETLFDPDSAGYGLYIVEQLVERYGGRIEVADNQPTGTVFTIRLPAAGRRAGSESSSDERPSIST